MMAAVAPSATMLKPSSVHQQEDAIRSNFYNMIGIDSASAGPAAAATAAMDSVSSSSSAMAQQQQQQQAAGPMAVASPAASSTNAINAAAAAASSSWVHPRSQNVPVYTDFLKYDRLADVKYSAQQKRRKTATEQETASFSSSPSSLGASPANGGKPAARATTKNGAKQRRRLNFNETVKVVPIPMRNEYSNRVRTRLWSNALEIHENAARNTIEFAAEGWDWRTVLEDESMYVCVATGELIHPCHYEHQGNYGNGGRGTA
jgi:hypothetical protein